MVNLRFRDITKKEEGILKNMRRKFRKYRRFNPTSLKLRRARKRKSILRSRAFWDSFLAAFLAILIFHLLFISSVFKIQKIEILAPENIPKNELQNILGQELKTPFLYFFQKDSFFLVDDKKIENRVLSSFPEIKTANLKKKFPKTLILEIEQKEAVATWCFSEENCFLINGEGIIYQGSTLVRPDGSRTSIDSNLTVIFLENGEPKNLGEKVISKQKISQLLEIRNELRQKLELGIEKFTLRGEERLDIKTTEGWEIYFDLAGDMKLALTKLCLLFDEEISQEARENLEYIDLRFSKVYYK